MKKDMATSAATYKSSGILSKFIIVLWCVITLFAIAWIVLASLSTPREIFTGGMLKSGLHFENYVNLVKNNNIVRYFANSIFYTVVGCAGVIFVAAPGSYALTRFNFRGKKIIQTLYASSMGIPGIMLMIPLFMVMSTLRLTGTPFVLGIIYIFASTPFTIFYLSGFFATLPKELEESALVEGCTQISAFWKVILPLAQPGIITVTIFNFISIWNEYMWALIFANTDSQRTLAIGLQSILNGMRYTGNWSGLFAAVVIVFIPTFILYAFLSEKIIAGITSGAVKG